MDRSGDKSFPARCCSCCIALIEPPVDATVQVDGQHAKSSASLLGLRVEGNESKPVPAPSPLSSSATALQFSSRSAAITERLDRCGLHGALNPCPSVRGSTAERQTPPSGQVLQVCHSVGYDRTNVRSRSSGCPARSWQLRLRRLPRRAHRRRPESGQLALLPRLPLRVEGLCDRRPDLCNRNPFACPYGTNKGIRNAAMISLAKGDSLYQGEPAAPLATLTGRTGRLDTHLRDWGRI